MGQLTQQEMKSRNDGQKVCVCVGGGGGLHMYSVQVCALRVVHVRWTMWKVGWQASEGL